MVEIIWMKEIQKKYEINIHEVELAHYDTTANEISSYYHTKRGVDGNEERKKVKE